MDRIARGKEASEKPQHDISNCTCTHASLKPSEMEKPRQQSRLKALRTMHTAYRTQSLTVRLEVEKRFAFRILLWKIVEWKANVNNTEISPNINTDVRSMENPKRAEKKRRKIPFMWSDRDGGNRCHYTPWEEIHAEVNMWNEYSRLTNDKFSLEDFFLAPHTPWTPGHNLLLSLWSLSRKKKPSNICSELNSASEICSRLACGGRRRKIIWRMHDDRRYFSSCSVALNVYMCIVFGC